MRVFLYDLAFSCFAVFYLPFFLVRLSQAESKKRLLADRFGFIAPELVSLTGSPRIWLHAVSVGEVLAVKKLIEELLKRFPQAVMFLSTVTPTGQTVAKKQLDARVRPFYLPFDISAITSRVLDQVKPDILILVETELWPNLITSAHTRNVPICVVNGRLSPRSFRRYYYFKKLMAPVVEMISKVAVQTERYQQRFLRVGFKRDRIIITGTMKYDIDEIVFRSRPDPEKFYERCGFPKEAKVIIAASTHKGEEEICLNAFLKLKATYPRLRLIIAPRHIQRAAIIGALVKEKSLALRVADEAGADLKNTDVQADVFVLNTIGQLASIYEQCDYVFMGGSLIRHGGQNPLEAVIFGKPIITGPHIFNFQEVYHDLVKCGGAYIVKSETEFDVKLAELVADEDKTISMGQAALDLLKSKRGATKRNCDMIENVLKSVAK